MKFILGVLVLYFLSGTANASDGIGECHCPANATRCCKGKEGSLQAPPDFPDKDSPAGGPGKKENKNAVVCYNYRNALCVVCRKGDESQKCCTISSPGKDTEKNGKTPYNEYLIGELWDEKDLDWHRLYQKMDNNAGYHKYSDPTQNRTALGLHPGGISQGCVTVTPQDCWDKLEKILSKGVLMYKGSNYNGFLYVVP